MIKTVTTIDGINTVDFGNTPDRYYWCKNIGDTCLHVSTVQTCSADADNVAVLNSGEFTMLENYGSQIYVRGAGKIEIHEQETPNCPFKSAPVSGGGGGESESEYAAGIVKEYNDFNNLNWVEITQHNDNSFVMSDENTIECCFMYSLLGSSNIGRIFETKDNAGYIRYILDIGNGFLDFSLNKEKWYSPTDGDYRIDTYEIIPNTLYNITAVFKNTGTDIYINGVLFVSIPETIAVDTRIKDLCLKASFKLSNREMEGRIFSLRMYNRALSENEIEHNRQTDIKRYGNT